MRFFDFAKLTSEDERMAEIHRLRFKVYCLECGYEDACDYVEGLESDEYDSVSTHFCATEADTGKVVGTARIINQSEIDLPALKYFDVDKSLLPEGPAENFGEISRLAISKDYRRRTIDKAIYGNGNVVNFLDEKERRNWRRRYEMDLVTGLYHCIYAESIQREKTHLYAVMSKSLNLLLKRWGLVFKPIGPAMDYHGIRRPYIASIEENMHWFECESQRMVR